jgi:AcrR family transcriptional regulator
LRATLNLVGLRERKKAETRRRIAETARRLFGQRGFHAVTVAEVAREAEVAEATLFNYFPTKEDLFYSGLEAFGAHLVEAVRARAPGVPAAVAFASFVLGEGGQLDRIAAGDHDTLERARTTARVILASPALQAREHQILLAIAAELASTLAPDRPGVAADPVPRAAANALMGVHIALLEYARTRLLNNDHPETIAADLRARGAQAFALLDDGLGDFAPAQPPDRPPVDPEAPIAGDEIRPAAGPSPVE